MTARALRSTRRTVALDSLDEYLDAWSAVRTEVEAAGGHAWLFRGALREDHFLEFIEWKPLADAEPLTERPSLAEMLAALDADFGHGQAEEWVQG